MVAFTLHTACMACRFTNWIDTLLINKTRQSINKSIHRIPKEKRFVSSEPFLFCIKVGYIDFANAGLYERRKDSLGQDAALHLAPNWRI